LFATTQHSTVITTTGMQAIARSTTVSGFAKAEITVAAAPAVAMEAVRFIGHQRLEGIAIPVTVDVNAATGIVIPVAIDPTAADVITRAIRDGLVLI
jgi:hypothetical protein